MSDIDPNHAIPSADGYLYRTPSEHVQGSPQFDLAGHEVRFGADAGYDPGDFAGGPTDGTFDIADASDDGGLIGALIDGLIGLFS